MLFPVFGMSFSSFSMDTHPLIFHHPLQRVPNSPPSPIWHRALYPAVGVPPSSKGALEPDCLGLSPTLRLTSQLTLSKPLNLLATQFPCLSNGDAYPVGWLCYMSGPIDRA